MYKVPQPILPAYSSSLNEEGLFLWIWNPEYKSPHIGVSINGEYFSLKKEAKQEEVDVVKILSMISRKEKPILFVELKPIVSKLQIQEAFKDYSSCEVDECSCSLPILNLFGVDKENAILFDLLNKLNENSIIKAYFQMHLVDKFDTIPSYSYADVHNNLQKMTV